MAASVTTTATTLEGQAFEIAQRLQTLELASSGDPIPNQVTIDPDFEAGTIAISITLPISYTTGAGGVMNVTAGTYL